MNATRLTRSVALLGALLQIAITASAAPSRAQATRARVETVALNPQPIPPGRYGRSALNPQPIPPGRGVVGIDIPDPTAGPRPVPKSKTSRLVEVRAR